MGTIPDWLDPTPWLAITREADSARVAAAIAANDSSEARLATLLSPAARQPIFLEKMARKAQALTRRHFGNTIALYVPLYLSNYCTGGCAYCGFASDRSQPRAKLSWQELEEELLAIKALGFEDILLLTGERHKEARFDYLLKSVQETAKHFHNVTTETYALSVGEYRQLTDAGCTGMTIYQETFDPVLYEKMHRWGEKRVYKWRIEAPARALEGGFRTVGLGALLGLGDPMFDLISLFRHVRFLQKHYWRAGISVSFPRICHQTGDWKAKHFVDERQLAQIIFAFRLCLPETPLTLSTREEPAFRDGIAGLGINRMSIASKTTVGGYRHDAETGGQFDIQDPRSIEAFCNMLRAKGLEPIFKNWEAVYRDGEPALL
ncbi:TPA: 2-iminoacetate synthase ThiH [Candidatus Sumerlaeota bacterium]|nr:2-iminoacetate synthase ThiH [Candidatus Sumerlaeota bacterium]